MPPKPAENKLKRDTPFIAKIKFRNELPDLPCDPKMLTAALDRHKLSQFRLTQMELAFRPDLVSGMEPGTMPLIDAERFCVDAGARELDPEDRAIIEGHKGKGAGNVSWLMKTRCAAYIPFCSTRRMYASSCPGRECCARSAAGTCRQATWQRRSRARGRAAPPRDRGSRWTRRCSA